MGASRARLLRQLVVEGAALAALGTAGGVMLAVVMLPALRSLVPAAVPRGDEVGLDASILWFAAGAAAVVTILAGLAPAWCGSRFDVAGGLKRDAASISADRSTTLWRRGLVALQAGLASALLVAAALLLVSFWRLVHVPLGFDAENVLTVEMRVLDRLRFRSNDQLRQLQREIVARVAAVPGVRAVAATTAVPFRGVDWTINAGILEDGDRSVSANLRQVDPEYFSIMQIPVRRGRLLNAGDAAGGPSVVVVSESFARAAFGDANPIGRELDVIEPYRTRIVGVVGEVRYASLARDPRPAVYVSRAQHPSDLMCLLVQTAGGGGEIGPAIRRAIRDVDPTLPAMHPATLGAITRDSLADRRFYTVATAIFAGLALVLTVVGLIVIVARTIVERRKELAIRTALGASAIRLQAGVVWQGVLPVAAGLVAGLAAAFAGATTLRAFLFDTPPHSAGVYAIVGGGLLLSAGAAGWLVARTTTTASPATVLRSD
jgi:predicted permease